MVNEKENLTNTILMDEHDSISNYAQEYMLSFTSDNDFINQNYLLKREHIERVVSYSEEISLSLFSDKNSVMIARLSALLHDIGRFEQFREYQTYNDSVSIDHAELAVKITEDKGWLNRISEREKRIIIFSILNHNKLTTPQIVDLETLQFCNILRDADKIDIIDLTIKEYAQNSKKKNKAFALELEDSPLVTKAIIKCIMEEKLPNRKEMKTITDFKLGQMAFIYDINFKHSFSIINKRQYLNKLFENLPKNDQIFEIYRRAKIYVENQLIK